MSQRTLLLLSTTLFCFVSSSAYCQSLSANSGINSADTYVIADLTVTNNSTFTSYTGLQSSNSDELQHATSRSRKPNVPRRGGVRP